VAVLDFRLIFWGIDGPKVGGDTWQCSIRRVTWQRSNLLLLFDLYVVPIDTLLAMDRLEPFETLHRQGTVVKYDPASMPTVIFVSQ
jgi:hypothetical protein